MPMNGIRKSSSPPAVLLASACRTSWTDSTRRSPWLEELDTPARFKPSLTVVISSSTGTPAFVTLMAALSPSLGLGLRIAVYRICQPGRVAGLSGDSVPCRHGRRPELITGQEAPVQFLGELSGGAVGHLPQRSNEGRGARA